MITHTFTIRTVTIVHLKVDLIALFPEYSLRRDHFAMNHLKYLSTDSCKHTMYLMYLPHMPSMVWKHFYRCPELQKHHFEWLYCVPLHWPRRPRRFRWRNRPRRQID